MSLRAWCLVVGTGGAGGDGGWCVVVGAGGLVVLVSLGAGGGVCVWAGEMVSWCWGWRWRLVEMAGGVCVCAGVCLVVMEVGGDGGWEVHGRWLVGAGRRLGGCQVVMVAGR